MSLYRAIRNALGSCYLGDTKLAKLLPFSSVQTFDSRLISFLQGLGQAVDVPAADAVSGQNIHDTLYGLGFTQSDRNARLQAFYNDLRYSIETRQRDIKYELYIYRDPIDNGTTITGPAGTFVFSNVAVSSEVLLTAAAAVSSASEPLITDSGFTFSTAIPFRHSGGYAYKHASQGALSPIQKTYANSLPFYSIPDSVVVPGSSSPFILWWSRSLSRIVVDGSGTGPVHLILALPSPRNTSLNPGVSPALLCLDELILRISIKNSVNFDYSSFNLHLFGNTDCFSIGDISPYSGTTLVLRCRTPAAPDISGPAWKIDAWLEVL